MYNTAMVCSPSTSGSHLTNLATAGFYTFPCAHPVGAELHFSNMPFAIHDSDFNLGKLSDGSE